jgi:hypothetical protein
MDDYIHLILRILLYNVVEKSELKLWLLTYEYDEPKLCRYAV